MSHSKTRKPPPQPKPKTENWLVRAWNKFKTWIKGLATKFANAFRAKERDAEGRITNQSWFGKYIASPIMRVLGWIGKGIIWTAQFLLSVLIVAATIVALIIAAILIAVTLAIYVVLLVIYRIVLGIGLALVTPYAAYHDRAASDAKWELYWKSWNPKYWISGDLENIPKFEEWYSKIKSEYFSGGEFKWTPEEFDDHFYSPSGAAA